MAERVETVRLTAQVSGYIAGMEAAAAATAETSTEVDVLAAKKELIVGLALGFAAFGAAVSTGLVLAVSKMADFDQKMSQVQTLSHATSDEMSQLSDAALHLGQNIGYSASEVANAEIELTKAGIGVTDQLKGGLKGALDLAAAGQLDVADATSIAASAMTQFKLSGADVPHIADLLAAGADKALGSVQDLGQGLKYVGPIANSMGISIEETVGTLSLLAQNGILAEQAGTSLRGMLSSLTSPSTQASAVMKQYGINIYDTSGKFVGFDGAAQQLKEHLGGLDQATRQQALGQIFGNQQITAATILMDGGAKTVDKWTKAVNDSGFAAQQAAGKMDNLKGDISKFQAAVDTGLIESATGANGALRGVVQTLTGLVTTVSNVPEPVLQAGFSLGSLVAVTVLVGGAALVAVPKFAAFKDALDTLKVSGQSAAAGLGSIAGVIGVVTLAVGAFAAEQGRQAAAADDFQQSLDQTTGALTSYTRAIAIKKLQEEGAFDSAKKAGISQRELTDAVLNGGSALDVVNAKLKDYEAQQAKPGTRGATSDYLNLGVAIQRVSGELANGRDQYANATAAADTNSASTTTAASAYLDLRGGLVFPPQKKILKQAGRQCLGCPLLTSNRLHDSLVPVHASSSTLL